MTTSTKATVEDFLSGKRIAYACLGYELGSVIAQWKNGHWCSRHETAQKWDYEGMSEARARFLFPSDAKLVA